MTILIIAEHNNVLLKADTAKGEMNLSSSSNNGCCHCHTMIIIILHNVVAAAACDAAV